MDIEVLKTHHSPELGFRAAGEKFEVDESFRPVGEKLAKMKLVKVSAKETPPTAAK